MLDMSCIQLEYQLNEMLLTADLHYKSNKKINTFYIKIDVPSIFIAYSMVSSR